MIKVEKILLKWLLGIQLLLTPFLLSAQQPLQKLYIESFSMDLQDQAARSFPKHDVNGDLYAVVKVRPSAEKFDFRFGMMKSIVDQNVHAGETWLYVQKNARKISISRDGFEPIINEDLGLTLEAGVTYILKLSFVEPSAAVQKQYLQFLISPADCHPAVKVRKTGSDRYELWGEADANGSISRFLECGRYEYQIVAENYLQSDGVVLLNTPNTRLDEQVTMVPNFGFLQVDDAYGIAGAQVFVNDRMIGTVPYRGKERWPAGTYTLSVTNGDLYKSYSESFTITNGQTTVLKPKLESNAAETKLVVNADAEIYIDKQLKGKREWTGPLREGRYEIECRMESHESTFRTIEVKADVPQTILLNAPRPRTGAVAVNSVPSHAAVIIDGKEVGHTPTVIGNLLIGKHTVELSLANHKRESLTVDIREGHTQEIQLELSTMARITIGSDPSAALLSLNGREVGTTPYTADMASGEYEVVLEKKGYKTLEQTVHLDASHPMETFTLKRQLAGPYGLYIQPTFQAGSLMAVGGTVGGFIANVNIEASYLAGLGESEEIFWSDSGTDAQQPRSEHLKPSFIGGKAGYGFVIGRSLRVTPQIGAGVLNLQGDVSSAHAVTASAGVRAEYVFIRHLGVSVAPEYGFAVSESDVFKRLSAVSPTFGVWASGFNVRIGVFFCL